MTEKEVKPTEPNEPKQTLKKSPLESSNLLFWLTFDYMTPLLWKGIRKTLELEDFWDLR